MAEVIGTAAPEFDQLYLLPCLAGRGRRQGFTMLSRTCGASPSKHSATWIQLPLWGHILWGAVSFPAGLSSL